MCTPSQVCALTYRRRFRTRIRGNLPVEVKPGRIVPQLVNQHGFTSPYDLNKHKTRKSYAGLPLSEERLGGRRSECAQIRVSPEEDRECEKLLYALSLLNVVACCYNVFDPLLISLKKTWLRR